MDAETPGPKEEGRDQTLAPGQATEAEMAELEDLPDDYMDPIPGVDDDSAADWGLEIMLEAAAEMVARGEPLLDPVTGEPRIPERVRRLLREF
jgi:hypothetical protein